jgi:hypothetical protein
VNEHILTAGDHLQLRFFRRGDRWQHVVECREADRVVWQLETAASDAIEIAANENWPCNPPFQNLEMHDVPDARRFALLVGMAGASHWSASVGADADRGRFVFDVACRVKAEPVWLGSCYVGVPSIAAATPRVELIEPAGEAAETTIETIDYRIIVHVGGLSGPLPRTVRWKYAISAAASS